MKQVLQHLSSGATEVAEVPAPGVTAGQVLIASRRSLISSGTERMLVDFGRANPIAKARQQPDKVRQVLEKVRTDGLWPTVDAVRRKLDQPLPMGYCQTGVVLALGAGVSGLAVGDRVVSNGRHAEVVSVPQHLCARVPDLVSDDAAAFVVPGAIALQGVRLAAPTLGESVVVMGLGLLGQLAVQLLRAHGCRVLGLDPDPERLALAERSGAAVARVGEDADPVAAAVTWSRGRGVDAVVVAAATDSHEPMRQAARMCRTRGRIVLVGVTGLELSRDEFYRKELTFQVSCSYGPGRYDPQYEELGQDYPLGFVRWTAQRNFEAVLDMLAEGRLDPAPLVSHRFPIADASAAYDVLAGGASALGILLEYDTAAASTARVVPLPSARGPRATGPRVAVIGAGNYASGILVPALSAAGAQIETVVSAAGVTAREVARRVGARRATTDAALALDPAAVDAVVVATRHDSHAAYVCRALEAGLPVFVEKPLCVRRSELASIEAAWEAASAAGRSPLVMVGFNRRFAPHVVALQARLVGLPGPKSMVMTVNAGAIPADHWTHQAAGGGRLLGEGCHFVDLMRALAGAPIVDAQLRVMAARTTDTCTVQLTFGDGSIGTLHYFANGARAFPKERLEVFAAGRIFQVDNFRTLRTWGGGGATMRSWRQDKGQAACAAAFVEAVRSGGSSPIPFAELTEVARVLCDLADAP